MGSLCEHDEGWLESVGVGVVGSRTRVRSWKQGCHIPSSWEGRQPPTTQAAVQDGTGISHE